MRDARVRYRSAHTIKQRARELLELCGLSGRRHFNIVHLVEDHLIPRLKGGLRIAFFDMKPAGVPAYVSYRPLTLHIDREIWRDAKIGDPGARYIVAHEIGHIVLHDQRELAFSSGSDAQLRAPENEESAEWQANVFAHFLLVPDEALLGNRSLEDVAAEISVPAAVIATVSMFDERRDAFEFVDRSNYTGDACGECGNFALVRAGTHLRCEGCGAAMEGY